MKELTKQNMMIASKVHYKFELMEETLYLTVNLIDRFLAVHSVVRKKLQLVGVTAMLIACKYEEVSVPVVDDLILISDKAYSRKEVLDMVGFLSSFDVMQNSEYKGYDFIEWFFAGEVDDQYFTVQSVCSNSLCLHEEVSQSCTI